MNIYSTCADCGRVMDAVDPAARSHPGCSEPSDPLRDLGGEYLSAVGRGDDATAAGLGAILDAPAAPPDMLAAALKYASWGWAVFPLRPGRKTPLTRHGFKDASADPQQIRAWWGEAPGAGIGLPTGGAFDVIDVDAPTGWASYLRMRDIAIPDVHGWAETPAGGAHLYVPPTGDPNRAGILPGIDYRGAGGYVAAPPSLHPNGFRYAWRHAPSPLITSTREAAA